ncbi:MAG: hypothetical protein SFV15_13740 [Polyangiaceae bacterium]|nr:hypothetical protein [Polyangiaceae bacterium]
MRVANSPRFWAQPLAWLTGCGLLACGSGGDIRLFPEVAPAPLPAEMPRAKSRNPLAQPYASTSIWNTAIGDGALLKPVSLKPATYGIRTEAVAVLLDVNAPTLSVQHSDAGWTGADRCPASAPEHFVAHAPTDFLLLEGVGRSGVPVVALQSDGRTLKQGLPFARCTSGAPATILFEEEGGDLYGDGLLGASGGSGLSALGGVLRLGELLPGSPPPSHALALHLFSNEVLWAAPTQAECFRWPASRGDGYCLGTYGGNDPQVRMGSLLALPSGALPVLRSEAAQKLAWTLQNYGAYIVNDAGASVYTFAVEISPRGWFVDEFEAAWGFSFQTEDLSTDWAKDVQTLFDALAVVTDNSADTPGGAGTRLQPALPELSAP